MYVCMCTRRDAICMQVVFSGDESSWTSLHVAAAKGCGTTIAALLSAGAPADARDEVWLL